MVLESAELHPNFPPKRERTWQEQGSGVRQVALWSEFSSSFCDTGCSSRAWAWGGHKVGQAPEKERQVFWLHRGGAEPLSPALLALYRCRCCVGVVARTVQSGKAGEARSLWLSSFVAVGVGGGPQAALRLDSLCPRHTGHVPVSQRLRTGTSKRSQTPSLSSRL